MKRCSKCQIVFHSKNRSRCLYCDTLLMTVENESEEQLKRRYFDGGGFQFERNIIKKILGDEDTEEHGRMQYIISSYFRSRTFHFMYLFSRNELLMGPKFKRLFVQPMGLFSALMIPWVIWNIFDSFAIRILYGGYCERCKSKYKKISVNQEHDPVMCEYNLEYTSLIKDILSGDISKTEDDYSKMASVKMKEGKKSAYNDLCTSRNYMSWMLDVFCIWFSVCLILFAGITAIFPYISIVMTKLDFL